MNSVPPSVSFPVMFHGTTESFDEAALARSVNGIALLKTAQHMLQGDHPEFVFLHRRQRHKGT